jgi:hypothetical protein
LDRINHCLHLLLPLRKEEEEEKNWCGGIIDRYESFIYTRQQQQQIVTAG